MVAAIVIAAIVAWRTGYFDATRLARLREIMRAAREVPAAPVVFTAAFATAVVLLLPTTPLSVIGGALFGMGALPAAWIGALAGSFAAHAIGRYAGHGWMRRFLGRHHMLKTLRDDMSVLDLARLRVVPAAPFGVRGYLAGMAAVPLRTLLAATAFAVLPSMAAYVFAGAQLADALEGNGTARSSLVIAGLVTAALVVAAAIPTVVKLIGRRDR
jgi:uncharacterized membrane protein YdjX (TVP38/TMEM64 family)